MARWRVVFLIVRRACEELLSDAILTDDKRNDAYFCLLPKSHDP